MFGNVGELVGDQLEFLETREQDKLDSAGEFTPITSFDDPALSWHNGSPNDSGGSAEI